MGFVDDNTNMEYQQLYPLNHSFVCQLKWSTRRCVTLMSLCICCCSMRSDCYSVSGKDCRHCVWLKLHSAAAWARLHFQWVQLQHISNWCWSLTSARPMKWQRERLGMVCTWATNCMVKITISPGSASWWVILATPGLPFWRCVQAVNNICRLFFSSGEGNVHNLTSNVMYWWVGICARLILWYYFNILSMLSFVNCFTFIQISFALLRFLWNVFDF